MNLFAAAIQDSLQALNRIVRLDAWGTCKELVEMHVPLEVAEADSLEEMWPAYEAEWALEWVEKALACLVAFDFEWVLERPQVSFEAGIDKVLGMAVFVVEAGHLVVEKH